MLGAILLEKVNNNKSARRTKNMTDEEILAQPYFDLIAASGENRHLDSDVESYNMGDGFIHLVLPENISRESLVVYVRNENGDLLARRVYNFNEKIMIGEWEVVIDTPTLPTLFFSTNDWDEYIRMIESPSTDLLCRGSMKIVVDEKTAHEKGWYSEYLSVADKKNKPYSASLQGRGSSSWNCEYKKSYSLRLEQSMNILGMGSAKNWNLIGNAYDPSLLKNTTFNNLANELGIKYQPKMEYINLYIDGKYQGVYLLTSKISVSSERVALNKGDMFFKMDAPLPKQSIAYESVTWFEDGNVSPGADLVYPKDATQEQLERAGEVIQRFIDCVENPDSEDFDKFVDLDSLVKYYWIQEAGMNFDAWQRSVYLYYKENEDKIYFGPVWDMDLTLGSPYEKAGMMFDSPEGFRICNAGWYSALFRRQDFLDTVVDYYRNQGVREALFDTIDEFERQKKILAADGEVNYRLFGHANMGTTLNFGDSYDEYCSNMIDFYRARIEFIDSWMMDSD